MSWGDASSGSSLTNHRGKRLVSMDAGMPSEKGNQLRRAVWHKEWAEAREAVGLAHLHFHDLRHTHGTLTAQVGATIRETMRRLGQSTIQAAMIYQHATDERDRGIALAIGKAIDAALKQSEEE